MDQVLSEFKKMKKSLSEATFRSKRGNSSLKILEEVIYFYHFLLKSAPALNPEGQKLLKEIAQVFYLFLFKPIESYISDRKNLYIIPEGILGYLPLDSLVMPDGRYMAEKYNIIYVQSASILSLLQRRIYSSNREQILALGGCIYE